MNISPVFALSEHSQKQNFKKSGFYKLTFPTPQPSFLFERRGTFARRGAL
jgi:hypothetical protein